MTQHPFERGFSVEEAAKINAEQKQADSGDELNEEDLEEIAGGIWHGVTAGINEGGITEGWKEGGIWGKDGNDIPTN